MAAGWWLLALLLATAAASPPSLGTVVLQGVLDAALVPIEDELVIPAGQCSGYVAQQDYRCVAGDLMTIGVEARDAAGAPAVAVAADLSSLTVRRAGRCDSELVLALSHACTYHPPHPARLVRLAREVRPKRAIPPAPLQIAN